jgi:hypothetical protein
VNIVHDKKDNKSLDVKDNHSTVNVNTGNNITEIEDETSFEEFYTSSVGGVEKKRHPEKLNPENERKANVLIKDINVSSL